MKIILWCSAIYEAVFAIPFVLSPTLIIRTEDVVVQSWVRNYGFAALSMAALSLLLLKKDQQNLAGLATLTIFHTGLTVSSCSGVYQGLTPVVIPVLHLALAIALAFYTFRSVAVSG